MAFPKLSIYGFGSEGGPDPDGNYSWGFGDEPPPGFPSGIEAQDTGFGDEPLGQDVAPAIIVPNGPIALQQPEYPDDGGVIVVLKHDFAGIGLLPSVFRVKIKNSFTAEQYPNSLFVQHCLSTNPLEGSDIVPTPEGKRLRFCLPTLPPGVYDIIVTYGPGFGMSLPAFEKAFRVIRRHWSDEQFHLRKLPEHWDGVGARTFSTEEKLGGV